MRRRVFWLCAYGIAMGVLEAAVVVYLREIYYPAGFRFPLVRMPSPMVVVEIVRESATIFMLLAVAMLSGRGRLDRFFVFGFLFGVWDAAYYGGLGAFLRWPASFLTWDVLFLIPVPWVSPVLYPLIVSFTLIIGFLAHEWIRARGGEIRPDRLEWTVASAGAVVIVLSFCWRSRIVLHGGEPTRFPLWVFLAGFLLALLPFVRAGARALRD